jgi:pimeloyl-ACP methyl ester carboxylesterase
MAGRFRADRRRVVLALGATAAAAGCRVLTPGPLEQPPRWFDPQAPRPPVVFVHGAFGSRLRNRRNGREIWPQDLGDLLVSSFDQLALPIDPETGDAAPDDIVADDLFEHAGMVEFYGSLVTMLVEAGGYRRAIPGRPVDTGPPEFYPLLYDWRRDFSRAAAALDGLVEQVRADHGDPSLKVDLVTHSSGGLVARYFLLYGARTLDEDPAPPDFSGAGKVRRVAAIGVPELGMARAVAALVEGEPIVLNRVYPEVLATAHSTFQLLPHGDDVWLLDAAGQPVRGDSCDVQLWREFQMSVFDPALRARVRAEAGSRRAGRARLALLEKAFQFRLQRARRFRAALRAAPVPATVPYHSIGGDCRATQARLLLERTAGDWHARTHPEDVHWRVPGLDYATLMMAGGDGTVTKSSATCAPEWPASPDAPPPPAANWAAKSFVCASHNQLVVSADCQRALLRALAPD